jgi:proteasome lid subunit RPN8/RPN11
MVVHALSERPNECCGLLAGAVSEGGRGEVVVRYPLVNSLASPIEYEADTRGLIQAHRDMRVRGIDVLAVYHSHPTSPAVPSRKDRERNYSEDVVSVIISLATVLPKVRAWWLTAEDAHEAEWVVVKADGGEMRR